MVFQDAGRMVVLWALVARAFAAGPEEALGEVLARAHVPAVGLSEAERKQAITSYAASQQSSPFLLAYYDYTGPDALPRELHVLRYAGAGTAPERATLRGTEMALEQVMQGVSGSCLGAALGIWERPGIIAINTHINPSAGCVLVLNGHLEFQAALTGWVVGMAGNRLIVEGNTMHFAPTHPGTVGVWDPGSRRFTAIYPAGGDERRREFLALLKKHLPGEEWCRENNNPCEAERFSTEIVNVAGDDSGKRFGFDAEMHAAGFGPEAERAVKPQRAHYEYELRNGEWVAAPAKAVRP